MLSIQAWYPLKNAELTVFLRWILTGDETGLLVLEDVLALSGAAIVPKRYAALEADVDEKQKDNRAHGVMKGWADEGFFQAN